MKNFYQMYGPKGEYKGILIEQELPPKLTQQEREAIQRLVEYLEDSDFTTWWMCGDPDCDTCATRKAAHLLQPLRQMLKETEE